MIELKPCPFCGELPELLTMEYSSGPRQSRVRCINLRCLVSPKTMWYNDEETPCKIWNLRLDSPFNGIYCEECKYFKGVPGMVAGSCKKGMRSLTTRTMYCRYAEKEVKESDRS